MRFSSLTIILAFLLLGCAKKQSPEEKKQQELSDKYSRVEEPVNGMIQVKSADGWGYLNEKYEEVIPCQYSNGHAFMETGLAVVSQNNGSEFDYGMIDKTGKVILPLQFTYIQDFKAENEGAARMAFGGVRLNSEIPRGALWGVVNNKGEEILPCTHYHIGAFSEGMAEIVHEEYGNNRTGYINSKGKIVIPCKWKMTFPFKDGLAQVSENNLYFDLLNKQGKKVTKNSYSYIGDFSEGLAAVNNASASVYSKNEIGFIDQQGKVVIPFNYSSAKAFSEGLAPVCFSKAINEYENKFTWGYINKAAKLMIKDVYDDADSFSDGMARVYIKNKGYGFIDKKGTLVIPCIYTEASDFSDGTASVKKYNQRISIGKDGKEVK